MPIKKITLVDASRGAPLHQPSPGKNVVVEDTVDARKGRPARMSITAGLLLAMASGLVVWLAATGQADLWVVLNAWLQPE